MNIVKISVAFVGGLLAFIGALLGVIGLLRPKGCCIMDAPDDSHESSMNDCGHRFKE